MLDIERRWAETPLQDVLSDWALGIAGGRIDLGAIDPADAVVLGAGNPDPATLPAEALLAAARRVLEKDRAGALRYGPDQGDPGMRAWLADRLNRQEHAGVGPDNFFITNGSGEGIEMIAHMFLNKGDVALVERPTYAASLRVLRSYGAEIAGVDMDADGVLPDAFEAAVRRIVAEGKTAKLFYTLPTFNNPTGVTTTVPRREAVAEICDRYRVLIMEDDAYGEIRIDGQRPPSYYKLTGGHGAVRLSTVSKMLATGLRVGWVTGRADIIRTLTRMRMDGGLSPFLIRTVAEFCTSGEQERHLERVIPVYREKRDRMIAALSERCSGRVTWQQPDGGFFLWLELAAGIDPARLATAMDEERIVVRDGSRFFPDPEPRHFLRLCYSYASVAEIEEGIRRLGRALDRCSD